MYTDVSRVAPFFPHVQQKYCEKVSSKIFHAPVPQILLLFFLQLIIKKNSPPISAPKSIVKSPPRLVLSFSSRQNHVLLGRGKHTHWHQSLPRA